MLATYFSVTQANYVKEFGRTTQRMDLWLLQLIQFAVIDGVSSKNPLMPSLGVEWLPTYGTNWSPWISSKFHRQQKAFVLELAKRYL